MCATHVLLVLDSDDNDRAQEVTEHTVPNQDPEEQPEVTLRDLKRRVFEVLPDDILPPPKRKAGV